MNAAAGAAREVCQRSTACPQATALVVRHGAVDYFEADGRPHPQETVTLTLKGVDPGRALGEPLVGANVVQIDSGDFARDCAHAK